MCQRDPGPGPTTLQSFVRVILLAGLAGLCSPNYSTGFCSTQHKVRQDSTTSDTSLECVRTKGTIKVNSMVKTSRTSPSKRPIPGGGFRKFHCHVLEPTQSSLSTGCSDMGVALTTQSLLSPQYPHQYPTATPVMSGL